MEIKRGIPVSPGIVIAEAFVLDSEEVRIPQRTIPAADIPVNLERFEQARMLSLNELESIRSQLVRDGRGHLAMIFESHQQILNDPTLTHDIRKRIEENQLTAEFSVARTFRQYKKMFLDIADPFFAHRATDFADIEKRLLKNLLGKRREDLANIKRPVIVFSHDLTPSQTAQLEPSKVAGFATDVGGPTSHTAILANALGIPAVVGLGNITAEVATGDIVILDGGNGKVILNPDESTRQRYLKRQEVLEANSRKLLEEVGQQECTTRDGVRVHLYANIEFDHEIPQAVKNGADGIGLFRTEFIYVQKKGHPTEQDHLDVYRSAHRMLAGRPLTIRTMDFGADKFAEELGLAHEDNPFLGCRSIRLSFEQLDIFRTQLRAILRASELGPTRVMFPMIISVQEVQHARAIFDDVKDELRKRGVGFDDKIKIGIMIEVPAAALIAHELAKHVDFFSIGTNDLVQYTLAVDRNNEHVAHLYRPDHPAVLELIKRTIDAGIANDIHVAMCGEMAGSPDHTNLLMDLGLRHFSMNPHSIPHVKKQVLRSTLLSVPPADRASTADVN